jgi:hypothetical protein
METNVIFELIPVYTLLQEDAIVLVENLTAVYNL